MGDRKPGVGPDGPLPIPSTPSQKLADALKSAVHKRYVATKARRDQLRRLLASGRCERQTFEIEIDPSMLPVRTWDDVREAMSSLSLEEQAEFINSLTPEEWYALNQASKRHAEELWKEGRAERELRDEKEFEREYRAMFGTDAVDKRMAAFFKALPKGFAEGAMHLKDGTLALMEAMWQGVTDPVAFMEAHQALLKNPALAGADAVKGAVKEFGKLYDQLETAVLANDDAKVGDIIGKLTGNALFQAVVAKAGDVALAKAANGIESVTPWLEKAVQGSKYAEALEGAGVEAGALGTATKVPGTTKYPELIFEPERPAGGLGTPASEAPTKKLGGAASEPVAPGATAEVGVARQEPLLPIKEHLPQGPEIQVRPLTPEEMAQWQREVTADFKRYQDWHTANPGRDPFEQPPRDWQPPPPTPTERFTPEGLQQARVEATPTKSYTPEQASQARIDSTPPSHAETSVGNATQPVHPAESPTVLGNETQAAPQPAPAAGPQQAAVDPKAVTMDPVVDPKAVTMDPPPAQVDPSRAARADAATNAGPAVDDTLLPLDSTPQQIRDAIAAQERRVAAQLNANDVGARDLYLDHPNAALSPSDVARVARENSMNTTPFSPHVAETNLSTAQQQMEQLVAGRLPGVPRSEAAMRTLFGDYERALANVKQGASTVPDYWQRMSTSTADALQQHVESAAQRNLAYWLGRLRTGR